MKINKKLSLYERFGVIGVWRCALLVFFISFAGWCFEKVGRYIVYNSITDRGFLSLPLCPIYGFSVLLIYLSLGSPTSPAIGINKVGKSRGRRLISGMLNLIIYFFLAVLLTSAIELVTGVFFGEVIGITLWNYEDRFMDLLGYVCPGYSLLWGGLISLFMLLVWTPLCRAAKKISSSLTRVLGAICLLLMTGDFVFNLIYILKTGSHFNFL